MDGKNADRIVDGRDLEPPEPFLLTMEALDDYFFQSPGAEFLN